LEKIKLFCLPYGGGSSAFYMSWRKLLDERIDLKPIELSGRGKRFSEPLYKSINGAIEDVYGIICEELDGTPYAIFGHSMGTLLAYESLRKIIYYEKQEPVHVFMSGRYPPYIEVEKEMLHLLSDEEFIDRIVKLGGTDQKVIENEEILKLFLPILRNDFRLVETYKHNGDKLKLNCEMSILNGKYDDFVASKEIELWSECTCKKCNFYEFDSGHFFINEYKEAVINIINNTLFADKNLLM